MLHMILAFGLTLFFALGAAWLADQPGSVTIAIGNLEITTGLLVMGLALFVFAGLVVFIWLTYHWIVGAPEMVGSFFRNRRRRHGFEALSRGMVAAAAGDAAIATREAKDASRQLGDSSLVLLLKVQTAQLQNNTTKTKRIFQEMLERPETSALGLRGLFTLALEEGDRTAARALAEQAVQLGPQIPWAWQAMFDLQATAGDWQAALKTLEARRRHKLIDRPAANRLAAVLRTAKALAAESEDSTTALDDALEAHRLVPDSIPAAALSARLLAEKGEAGRAARIVERTWRANPHPDLALIYGHVHPGDSANQSLTRAKSLAARAPESLEGPIAIARAALQARAFDEARAALGPLLDDEPSQRICVLMAEIENAENGDLGRVREWLTRAVSAPRDPAWTADGFVSKTWLPISPVTGRIDAFEWRVPGEGPPPEFSGELQIPGADAPEDDGDTPVLALRSRGDSMAADETASGESDDHAPDSEQSDTAGALSQAIVTPAPIDEIVPRAAAREDGDGNGTAPLVPPAGRPRRATRRRG